MKYAIVTFGCRVNQADSLRIEEGLRAGGGVASAPEQADVVVVNTCSVTATADQGARQAIRRINRDNPAARLVVTGCYATRRPDEVAALPGVIRLVPNDRKERLVDELPGSMPDLTGRPASDGPATARDELTTAGRFGDGEGACGAAIEPGVAGRTAYTLRVQTGCEERCAYCIIPSTRGTGRSLPLGAVVAEATRVAAAGFKEVVLTGVHLGSYGRDVSPSTTLLDLLRALAAMPQDLTFRISSLEPMDCEREIVDLMATSDRIAPHLHLPLQHASDRVLQAMRRPYTLHRYRRLVDHVRDRLPQASIGSDVIAGFPGETDEDVERLLAYLPSSPLTHLHVFPYSDRPGTAASAISEKVPGPQVRARAQALRAIGRELTRRFRESHVGAVRPGLTLEDGTLVVTDNYLKVRVPGGRRRNERVRVRIVAAGEVMRGLIIED